MSRNGGLIPYDPAHDVSEADQLKAGWKGPSEFVAPFCQTMLDSGRVGD